MHLILLRARINPFRMIRMEMVRRIAGSLLVAAVVVSGVTSCEEAPSTMAVHRVENPWSFAWGVLRQGPMLVEIRGNPYGIDPVRFRDITLEAMTEGVQQNAEWAVTTDPNRAGSRSLRLVMTFNGASTVSGLDQCLGRAAGGGPLHRGFVWVVATFCDRQTVLASVTGKIATTDSASDPKFAALIHQVMIDMFQAQRRP